MWMWAFFDDLLLNCFSQNGLGNLTRILVWTCSVWCLKFFIKKLKRKIYQSYLNCAWLATRVLQFLLEHLMLWSPWILSLWSAKSLLDQVDVCSQRSHGKLKKNNVFETMGWIFCITYFLLWCFTLMCLLMECEELERERDFETHPQ